MATQTSTLTIKGKLGNVVGYKNRGKNIARIRVESIKNPNTTGQAIQRMITATNARAYSRLKKICDHSFEGVSYGQKSMDFFLKKNAKTLREWVASTWPEFPQDMDVNSWVGLTGVENLYATGVGLLISKGSLPEIVADRTGDNSDLAGFGDVLPQNATVLQFMQALGAQKGDQISVVFLDAPEDASVKLARYVTDANASDELYNAAFTDAALRAVCLPSSIYNADIVLRNVNNRVLPTNASGETDMPTGVAMILSRKQADGTFLRSTQRLIWGLDYDTAELGEPQLTIPEWEAGKTVIDTESPYFLNQPRTTTENPQ
jgi:hypothetical protein